MDLYFTSVGRNSKLLLNVPPTRAGLLHETDVIRLAAMGERLAALFGRDLPLSPPRWTSTGPRSATAEFDLGGGRPVAIADLREDITGGQLVSRYRLEGSDGGEWRMLSQGSTIGYRKLDRWPAGRLSRVRLTIEDALDRPVPVRIQLYPGV